MKIFPVLKRLNKVMSASNSQNAVIRATREPRRSRIAAAFFLCLLVFPVEAVAARKHALVIGINDYKRIEAEVPNLKYAVNDAKKVAEILLGLGFQKHDIHLLTDNAATRGSILGEYYEIRDQIGEEDDLFVYFAGHGVRDSFTGEQYWVTHLATLREIEVEGIRVRDILRLIEALPARRKLVILDHCYSGDFTPEPPISLRVSGLPTGESSFGRNIDPRSHAPPASMSLKPDAFLTPDGRKAISEKVWEVSKENGTIAIIGAATDTAFEHKDLKHGLLTSTFIQALTDIDEGRVVDGILGQSTTESEDQGTTESDGQSAGDGRITVHELLSYMKQKTEELGRKLGLERQYVRFQISQTSALRDWVIRSNLGGASVELIEKLEKFLTRARQAKIDIAAYNQAFAAVEEAKKFDGDLENLTCEMRTIFERIVEQMNYGGDPVRDSGIKSALENDILSARHACSQ